MAMGWGTKGFLGSQGPYFCPIALWLFWEIFVQKVLEYEYQLQMNLIDLLDIKRPQKVIKRPKKAIKVVKAKSKARSSMV